MDSVLPLYLLQRCHGHSLVVHDLILFFKNPSEVSSFKEFGISLQYFCISLIIRFLNKLENVVH